jgi:hypothetical protein
MSGNLGFEPAIKTLVAALQGLPELAGFTITDRPPGRRALPAIRVGPVKQEPWSTNSSIGAKLDITLTLASRTGSFAMVSGASEAVLDLMAGPTLTLSVGTTSVQTVSAVRLDHASDQNLELATLTITLFIDLGDAP